MKRIEFLQKLSDRGYTREEAAQALSTWRSNGKSFDDEAPAEVAPSPEQPQKESNVEFLGHAAKAIGNLLIPEAIQDIPKIASAGAGIIKGGARALGDIFSGKDYAQVINKPGQGAIGAGKGVGAFGYNTLSGMFRANPNFQQIMQAQQASGEQAPESTLPQWLQPSNEAQEAGSRLSQAGLTLGAVAAGGAAIAKGSLSAMAQKKLNLAYIDKSIEQGVSKGIKPTVIGKPSLAKMDKFYNNAKDAVNTIAENKDLLKITDANGEIVSHPQTAAQFAQAIDQSKKIIYDKYNAMAQEAGDSGAMFKAQPVIEKLDKFVNDLSNPPEVRKYAEGMKDEILELDGAAPDIVQKRIAHYNKSLQSFYAGRTAREQAEVDGSLANAMREELDNNITNAVGEGYQGLKNQYGSLKAIENEVNKRSLVNARRVTKGLADLTDVFTGGEIISGLMTMNPALIAKGVAGVGIKEFIKSMNNPDRYISNMFKDVYRASDAAKLPQSVATTSVALPPNVSTPTYFRQGKRPLTMMPGEAQSIGTLTPKLMPSGLESISTIVKNASKEAKLTEAQTGKLQDILESINKQKIDNPKLDADLLTNKIINDLKSKRSKAERDDMLQSLMSRYPIGKKGNLKGVWNHPKINGNYYQFPISHKSLSQIINVKR